MNKLKKGILVLGIFLSSFVVNFKSSDYYVAAEEPSEVLYVNFDDNVNDHSGKDNHGTVMGLPLSYVDGIRGKAAHIKNSNGNKNEVAEQYISFGNVADLQFGESNYAFTFWYKTDNGTSMGGAIISNKDYASGANQGFTVGTLENGVASNFKASGTRKDIRGISPLDGQWHFIAVNVDRSSNMTAYVDGEIFGSVDISSTTGTIDMGDFVVGADGLGKYGLNDSYIDELKVYRETVSATMIEATYIKDTLEPAIALHESQYGIISKNSAYDSALVTKYKGYLDQAKAFVSPSISEVKTLIGNLNTTYAEILDSAPDVIPGLVLQVNFDDKNANDLSGYGNNGNVVGNPEFVDGVIGKAVHIKNTQSSTNPANQYIDFGKADGLQFGEENFAISLWYKSDNGTTDGAAIISNKNYASGSNKGFALGNFDNGVRFNFTAAISNRRDVYGVAENDGEWHHIAVNVDRQGSITTYCDGVLTGTTDISAYGGSIDLENFVIGADGIKTYGLDDSYIDEVYVYNRLMSADEITAHYKVSELDLLIKTYEDEIATAKTDGVTLNERIVEFEAVVNDAKASANVIDISILSSLITKLNLAHERFLDNRIPLISFQVISDPHLIENSRTQTNSANLIDALNDIAMLDPTSSVVLYPGDITDSGKEVQYAGFYDVINNFSSTKSLVAIGNHDVRWLTGGFEEAKERFLRYNADIMGDTDGNVYYDEWIDGYHFVVLNTEKDYKDQAYLSPEQLAWLDEKLSENEDPDKPIFLMVHQALEGTYEQAEEDIIEQSDELKEVLKKHPTTVMFTGHIHNGIDIVSAVNIGYGTQVDVPSFYYSSYGDKTAQVGYQVNVFEDSIEIRMRDFKNDIWLDDYQMTIDIHDVTITDDKKDIPINELSVTAGTEQGGNEAISKVIDDDTTTFWHGAYSGAAREDQYVIFEMDKEREVDGVRYLPRQTGSNGKIKGYTIFTSTDGVTWEQQATGTWFANKLWQSATFEPVEAKYVKIQVDSHVGTGMYSSAAELRVTQPLYADFTLLSKEIITANLLHGKIDTYTAESLLLLKAEITKAEAVLANDKASQEAVDAARLALVSAYDLLEYDKSELEDEIGKAEITLQDTELYTKESLTLFEAEINKAKAVLNDVNADKADIDAAVTAVTNAYDLLKYDSSKLEDEVNKAETTLKNTNLYTKESLALFETEINKAKAVLNDVNADKAAIDAAVTTIVNAYDLLEEKEIVELETTKLSGLVDSVNSLNEDDYTADSWNKLEQALKSAEAILNDTTATQAKIDTAYVELKEAYDKLEKVTEVTLDLSELNELLESATKLKESDYTSKTWNVFKETYDEAKQLSAAANLQNSRVLITQDQIDDMCDRLSASMVQLEKVSKETPTEEDKKPPVVDNGSQKPNTENGDGKASISAVNDAKPAKTGDDTNVTLLYILIISAIAVLGIVIKKRKHN